uniref:Chitin-binding type-2 domain-containing protein n=1 Tax=Strigamia maritima TaxID=126957 RepID=T1J4M3_STRMM
MNTGVLLEETFGSEEKLISIRNPIKTSRQIDPWLPEQVKGGYPIVRPQAQSEGKQDDKRNSSENNESSSSSSSSEEDKHNSLLEELVVDNLTNSQLDLRKLPSNQHPPVVKQLTHPITQIHFHPVEYSVSSFQPHKTPISVQSEILLPVPVPKPKTSPTYYPIEPPVITIPPITYPTSQPKLTPMPFYPTQRPVLPHVPTPKPRPSYPLVKPVQPYPVKPPVTPNPPAKPPVQADSVKPSLYPVEPPVQPYPISPPVKPPLQPYPVPPPVKRPVQPYPVPPPVKPPVPLYPVEPPVPLYPVEPPVPLYPVEPPTQPYPVPPPVKPPVPLYPVEPPMQPYPVEPPMQPYPVPPPVKPPVPLYPVEPPYPVPVPSLYPTEPESNTQIESKIDYYQPNYLSPHHPDGYGIHGIAGTDYPNYNKVPEINFQCSNMQYPGYYGIVETRCQVFLICQADGRQDSFLCPNGTIFNQKYFVCDWWYHVDCNDSPNFYHLNSFLSVLGHKPMKLTYPTDEVQVPMPTAQDPDGDGIMGTAGKDYPINNSIPPTEFKCSQQKYPGYYADPAASCQYVIIHSSSNATSSSYSQSVSSSNENIAKDTTVKPIVDGLEHRVTADASVANEATVVPPSAKTMYYNGARGNEHFIAVSYEHQIPGLPGNDYPIYSAIPTTGFQCSNAQTGYFADEKSGCQVIHICQEDGTLESFLCPNGTIFNQQYLVCDWWFNVDCSKSKDYYSLNGIDSRPVPNSTPSPYIQDQSVSASIQEHTLIYPDDQLASIEYIDGDFESQETKEDS